MEKINDAQVMIISVPEETSAERLTNTFETDSVLPENYENGKIEKK